MMKTQIRKGNQLNMNINCVHLLVLYMIVVAIGHVQADGSPEDTAPSAESDESREVEAELYRLRCVPGRSHGTPCKHKPRSTSLRFYYDVFERRCRHFQYAGCGGNANNFMTMEECEYLCSRPSDHCTESPTDHSKTDFNQHCLSHPNVGRRCEADSQIFVRIKFYYKASTNSCEPFEYLGCDGNYNQYTTKRKCEEACVMHPGSHNATENNPPESGVGYLCKVPPDEGIRCSDDKSGSAVTRFYFNETLGTCESFNYSGCGGNSNKYHTITECEDSCRSLLKNSSEKENNCSCNPEGDKKDKRPNENNPDVQGDPDDKNSQGEPSPYPKAVTDDLSEDNEDTPKPSSTETADGQTTSPGAPPSDVEENLPGSTNGSQDHPSENLPPLPPSLETPDDTEPKRPNDTGLSPDYPRDDPNPSQEITDTTGEQVTPGSTTNEPKPPGGPINSNEEQFPGTNETVSVVTGETGGPETAGQNKDNATEPTNQEPTPGTGEDGHTESTSKEPTASKESTGPTPDQENPGKNSSDSNDSRDPTPAPDGEDHSQSGPKETTASEEPAGPTADQEYPGNNSSDSKESKETTSPTGDDEPGKKNASEPALPEGDQHEPNGTETADTPATSPESTNPMDSDQTGKGNASEAVPPGETPPGPDGQDHPESTPKAPTASEEPPSPTDDQESTGHNATEPKPEHSGESTNPTSGEQSGKGNASDPTSPEKPTRSPDGNDYVDPTEKKPTASGELPGPTGEQERPGGNGSQSTNSTDSTTPTSAEEFPEVNHTEPGNSAESTSPTSGDQPTKDTASEPTTHEEAANATADGNLPTTPDSSKNRTTGAPITPQPPVTGVTPRTPDILPPPEERQPVYTSQSFARYCLVYPWNGQPCGILGHHNGYYYDAQLQICRVIYYSGCDTSNNYYHTLDACVKFCERHPNKVKDDNYRYNFEYGKNDRCLAPLDAGMYCISNHHKTEMRYYFNHTTKTCQQFVYGGCGGNANKYRTENECYYECSKYEYTKNDRYEDRLETTFEKILRRSP